MRANIYGKKNKEFGEVQIKNLNLNSNIVFEPLNYNLNTSQVSGQ